MENRCVCCGEIIPESLQVCRTCYETLLDEPAPCKDCDERNAECHCNCERYQLWKVKHRAYVERVGKNRFTDWQRRDSARIRYYGRHDEKKKK